MSDQNDEVRELRERIARLEENTAPKRPTPQPGKGGCLPFAMAVGAVALAVFLVYAWNVGRMAAERDEAIQGACRSAGAGDAEINECISRMDAVYVGDLTAERTYNAAASQVDAIRDEAE